MTLCTFCDAPAAPGLMDADDSGRDPVPVCEHHALPRDSDGSLTAYAWPGGYPVLYLSRDGCTLCPSCADDDGAWDPAVDYFVAYEGEPVSCDDCGSETETAYGPVED